MRPLMDQVRYGWVKPVLMPLLLLVVGGAAAVALLGTDPITAWFHKDHIKNSHVKESQPAAELVRDKEGLPIAPATVRLTPLVASTLGIKPDTTVQASIPK